MQQRAALGLDAETLRVLEQTLEEFRHAGAKLDEAGKARLAAINEELASLGATLRPERAGRREGMGAVPRGETISPACPNF